MSLETISIVSIRGATTAESNTKECICSSTLELINTIIAENNLDPAAGFVNCIVGSTKDISAYYPAAAITESGLLEGVPLFSTQEPEIDGQLPLTIRVMFTLSLVRPERNIRHIYLRGAKCLNRNA